MESLGIELSNIPIDILLNILNIVLLFLIVRKLAYKPVRKFMDARTARVTAAAAEAAAKSAEADALKAKYEAMLSDGETQNEKTLEDAKKQASAEAAEIVEQANRRAEAILDEAKRKAKQTHDDALKDMQGDVVALAFDISEKLLERSVRDADTKKMADRLFDSRLNGGDSQ
ncbi:MAG: ATP synthase F0 subunit B [Acutalibacteraceae bacterium]